MQVVQTRLALCEQIQCWQQEDLPASASAVPLIGFVPTMGSLHIGHAALLAAARKECQKVVCSLFINPAQFDQQEDYAGYPRDVEKDKVLLAQAGCDLLFLPSVAEIYDEPPRLKLDFGFLAETLEGAGRPGHFQGVGIVLSRLFHFVRPSVAYFGEKDWQQCLVVERLVKDLGFDLSLRWLPTIRESNGLACSSRNDRLSPLLRKEAGCLHETLRWAAHALLAENRSLASVETAARSRLQEVPAIELEYFCIVDSYSLAPVMALDAHESISLCLAARVGPVRLIDNLRLPRTDAC